MTFVKGQSGNPKGRKVGSKNRLTLLKEERRAIFDKEVSQMWEDTIRKMKPEYIGDQFLGKAPEKFEGKLIVDVSEQIIKKRGLTPRTESDSE